MVLAAICMGAVLHAPHANTVRGSSKAHQQVQRFRVNLSTLGISIETSTGVRAFSLSRACITMY